MKIEAAARLVASPTNPEAFTDAQGKMVLDRYDPRAIQMKVKTTIKGTTLSVMRQPSGKRMIMVYVLFKDEPIGVVAFEPMWTKMYSPHAYFKPEYRRKGYASAVYEWVLRSSVGLVTDGNQSPGARMMWAALGKKYPLLLVNPRTNRVLCEGDAAIANADQQGAELVLLGQGVTVETFKRDFDFK